MPTFLREIMVYCFGSLLILCGLILLRIAFRKVRPEQYVAGKKELPVWGRGSKVHHIYIGAVMIILGIYAILKIRAVLSK